MVCRKICKRQNREAEAATHHPPWQNTLVLVLRADVTPCDELGFERIDGATLLVAVAVNGQTSVLSQR